MESLVIPLQEQIDEWKKTAVHLDKDHTHGVLTYKFYVKYTSNICSRCRCGIQITLSPLGTVDGHYSEVGLMVFEPNDDLITVLSDL